MSAGAVIGLLALVFLWRVVVHTRREAALNRQAARNVEAWLATLPEDESAEED